MIQSKALKDFESNPSKLYLWWIETQLADWYYDYSWKFFGKPLSHIKKLWGWYWNVFKDDFDFDGHSLYAIIEYKLKRLEKVLLKGHAIQEPKDMKALKLAIKLAGRLKDDKYEDRGYDRTEKKYGELEMWFEPCNDGTTNSYMRSSRPKVITEVDEAEEIAFRREQYELSEYRMKRETRWLYAILANHLRSWWD
jgi:hypothetical protein